jgi:tRNA-binding EMAP/Myf-like protein
MERRLATIQIIKNLRPIPNADKIEVAEVLGWECVVKKDEFKIGEKIIYCEVDSVMPEKPDFEFLRDRKFRIKTIKLRGQVSQGLVLPLYTLKFYVNTTDSLKKFEIGEDVTEILGINKYLTPSEEEEITKKTSKNKYFKYMMKYPWFRKLVLSKKTKNPWPYWVEKTDEERIQNMPEVLQDFSDVEVYVTEKIDYQSVTFTSKFLPRFKGKLGKILSKKYKFIVCSRKFINNNKTSLYWQIANKYKINKILTKEKYNSITIQGEQGAPQVQGNKYKLNTIKLWVFNVIDHNINYFYNYDELTKFCGDNKLERVPLIKKCKLSELGSTVQELIEFSKGKSVLADIPREGIVVRCIENGRKIFSFKVINPDFLLKYEN